MAFQPLRPDRDLTVLIPARAGSKRIRGKNTRLFAGKPLIQWTIEAAQAAHVAQIIVSSDDPAIWPIARYYDLALHVRQPAHATDSSPDIDWVLDVLPMVQTPYVAICRPTSPFRTASTIRRGYAAFMASGADSIRAVEKVTSPHPAKMWRLGARYMEPVMAGQHADGTPYHSSPTQSLPVVYIQNACLEIAAVASITATGTISGHRIAPFFTEPLEGVDLNTEEDWVKAEAIAVSYSVKAL